MTCVAWDGKMLAADRMSTFDGLEVATTKIYEMPRDHLFGAAGDSGKCRELREWHKRRITFQKDNPHPGECGLCSVIIITDRGVCEFYEGNCTEPVVIESMVFAIGSGAHAAMAAMLCDKSARQAVMVASQICRGVGLGSDSLTLKLNTD